MLGGPLRASFRDELGLTEKAWISLPSTKMKRPSRADPFSWCYTYTGFSLAFARAALTQLGAELRLGCSRPVRGLRYDAHRCGARGLFGLGRRY